MGVFLFAAMSLIACTLVVLLRPWQRRHPERDASTRQVNAGVYRDQLAELDRDLAIGVIGAAEGEVARDELQRRLIEDTTTLEPLRAQAALGRQTLIAIAIALPLGASGLYALLGEPAALLPQSAASAAAHQGTSAEIERMVTGLAARLEKNPADPKGWAMLARSYQAMGRFSDASTAFARVGDGLHQDPMLLTAYADSLASSAGGNLEGEPMKLVSEALRLDPDHAMALSLAAMAAYKRRDFTTAALHWQHLLNQLPPDSEDARWVVKALAEVGAPATLVAATPIAGKAAVAVSPADDSTTGSVVGRSIAGIVSLAPALRASVKPDDTVFVFARATDGSRMPLAVQRARVADLPLRFRLDDSMAMSPQAKISGAKEVRIEALVSRGGTANAAPGDLIGSSLPMAPGAADVALSIDRVRP
jgi:cytochrome c-type biogenesis protein CcmH